MTGHGQASVQNEQFRVVAEVRSVNNRFLKTSINCDMDAEHQAKIEALIKRNVSRGSVNFRIKTHFLGSGQVAKLNESVLRSYWLQLSEIAGNSQSINLESILTLPGIVQDNIDENIYREIWPIAEQAITQALTQLNMMRAEEGVVMQKDMQANCVEIAKALEEIKQRAPSVIENYSKKMTDRINKLLESYDVSIQATDIIKEVGVFAEKCDVSEETVRLGSHIEQFNKIIREVGSNGKKLDFLVQEMLRETNTIGSKANDVTIAGHVVEIKTAIERIREMVQNVE
jgi:uncharacterized protein (TIGR00255 family)